jgi:MFS family permease
VHETLTLLTRLWLPILTDVPGQLVTLVPLYQSEIAPPKIRGLLVGTHGVIICLGYTLAAWIGVGFYFVNASGAQWRIPLAIQCVPPLFLALGVLFLPESPRWCEYYESSKNRYTLFKLLILSKYFHKNLLRKHTALSYLPGRRIPTQMMKSQ